MTTKHRYYLKFNWDARIWYLRDRDTGKAIKAYRHMIDGECAAFRLNYPIIPLKNP